MDPHTTNIKNNNNKKKNSSQWEHETTVSMTIRNVFELSDCTFTMKLLITSY